MNPHRRLGCAVILLAAVTVAPAPRAQSTTGQQAPSFRSGVIAVPIDVRVLDKTGQPITDLKKEDFKIVEDGVPQTIEYFFFQTLASTSPLPALRARPDTRPFDTSPQANRVFLLMLGTRALRQPETLDALLRFVRDRLLSQDQVAVLGPPRRPGDFNQAIDFTSDRQKAAAFLETYRGAARTPVAGSSRPDPASTQQSVFATPGSQDASPKVQAELGFEQYVKAWGKQSLGGEIAFLMYAIKYLRYMQGEKHVVFVTERGPDPTWEQVKYLTSAASDARVALDTIQIGDRARDWRIPRLHTDDPIAPTQPMTPGRTGEPLGVTNPSAGENAGSAPSRVAIGGEVSRPSPVTIGPSARESAVFSNPLTSAAGGLYDLKFVAKQTGGQASMLEDADVALARIDTATRAHYLLGYYPTNATWNGGFRSIRVTVNRPDATVLFRKGYYASQDANLVDWRRFVSTARIEGAGHDLGDIRDIDVRVTPSFKRAPSGSGGEATAQLSIDVSRLSWTIGADGRNAAQLEVAIYCGDADGQVLGSARRLLKLALSDTTYDRVMAERYVREMRVPVTKAPRLMKVIVYDYDADLVGTTLVKIPR